MHLFDPSRPQAAPGVPALLVDGSAVPIVAALPLENGKIRLSLMLRSFDTKESFSYSWRHCELSSEALPDFFALYIEEPEETIRHYFHWSASPKAKPMLTIRRAAPTPTLDTQTNLDLI